MEVESVALVASEGVRPWLAAEGFPWQGVQFYTDSDPLSLDSGAVFPSFRLAYEEWGPKTGQPVVVFHALTGDSHVAPHSGEDRKGWWNGVMGPGQGLDTNQYHVLCLNVLGGALGSTGPWSLHQDGKPYGSRFPHLTLFDMARAAHRLIGPWAQGNLRLIGGSMGGMLAYAYAALYPDEVQAIFAIGAPIGHEPWAIAYHSVGRMAIMSDVHFAGGDYYEGPFPDEGLKLARMADMLSYQHPQSMQKKFGRQRQDPDQSEFQITSYLRYQGQKLVRRFDANTYIVLTTAMDEFALTMTHMKALGATSIWMVGIQSDLLYLPEEIERHYGMLRDAGVPAQLQWLSGPWGHDTFLVEQERTAQFVREFLQMTR